MEYALEVLKGERRKLSEYIASEDEWFNNQPEDWRDLNKYVHADFQKQRSENLLSIKDAITKLQIAS